MSEADLFLDFVRRFEALQLEYMLTGSVAATMYGEPRVTHDVDVVLLLPRERIRAFAAAFPLETHYCPPEETLLQEVFRTSPTPIRSIARASRIDGGSR